MFSSLDADMESFYGKRLPKLWHMLLKEKRPQSQILVPSASNEKEKPVYAAVSEKSQINSRGFS